MQRQPCTKLSSSCHAPKHVAVEAGHALLRARLVLLESWTSAGRSGVRDARDKGSFAAADDVIMRTDPRAGRGPRQRRKKRRFRLAGGRGQRNGFSRSQLHDGTKKVAPGCYPMPLLAILPEGRIEEGRSYAASSSVSSVVGWLLFALVTKRCLISAFCSCTLDAPAGVLSIA